MRVLVTGGAGYVGSMLVPAALTRGHEVSVYDSLLFGDAGLRDVRDDPRLTIVVGDIRDRSSLASALAGADAVVHLAALVGDPACAADPSTTVAVNVNATLTIAELANRAGVRRLVFSSTCSNYGVTDSAVLADEITPLKPLSVYAETKVNAERSVLDGASPTMSATVFRFATIFGLSGRMRFDTLVNEFVRNAVCAKRLDVYGPSAWRPLVHLHDAVTSLVTSLELPAEAVSRRVFNVVGSNHRKRELAELIQAEVGDARVECLQDREDRRDYRVSAAKWNTLAKPPPFRSVAEGVREIAAALRSGALGDP